MAKVTTTFVSDDKELAASIEKMNQQMAKLADQNKKLSEQSQASSKKTSSMIDGVIGFGMKAVSAYGIATTGLNALNRAIQDNIELQKKAADAHKATAGGEREFLLNLGLAKGADRNLAMQSIKDISGRTGMLQRDVYTIGSEALSASGGNIKRAMGATELAARVAPHDVATAEALASGMLHLSKATKTNDPSKNLSAIIGLGQVSAVSKWDFLANNLVPGAIGISGFGGKPEETFGLLAAIDNAMGDKRGDQAKTAGIALAEQLEKFLPEKDLYEYRDGKNRLIAKGTGLDTTAERIAAIQADPALRDKFLSAPGTSFEKQAVIPVRRMLTRGTTEAEMLTDTTKAFAEILKTDQTEEFISKANDTPIQKTAELERSSDQIIEQMYLQATEKARYGIVASKVDETLAGMEYGSFRRFIKRNRVWGSSFSSSPAESGVGVLEEARFTAQAQAEAYREQGRIGLAETRETQAKAAQDMIDLLRRIEANQHASQPNTNNEGS